MLERIEQKEKIELLVDWIEEGALEYSIPHVELRRASFYAGYVRGTRYMMKLSYEADSLAVWIGVIIQAIMKIEFCYPFSGENIHFFFLLDFRVLW